MFDYVVFRVKRVALQLLCNFIPLKAWRVRARNALCDKYCPPLLGDRIVLLSEVNRHLPRKVLVKINAYENEYFAAQNAEISTNLNAQILANAAANERERERESKWRACKFYR